MITTSYDVSLAGLGNTITGNIRRQADGSSARSVALPAGRPGTLSTRTGNDAGTVTLSTGHGITTGKKVDLYWEGGVRYGVTVGTVAGNTVPLTAATGAGAVLPPQSTAVVVAPQLNIHATFYGDQLKIMGMAVTEQLQPMTLTSRAHVQVLDEAADEIAALVVSGGSPRIWDIAGGDDNPFAGEVASMIRASCSSTTPASLSVVWAEDVTPDD